MILSPPPDISVRPPFRLHGLKYNCETHFIFIIIMSIRAGQESKLSENVPRQLNSYVKLNFKAGLFSSIF